MRTNQCVYSALKVFQAKNLRSSNGFREGGNAVQRGSAVPVRVPAQTLGKHTAFVKAPLDRRVMQLISGLSFSWSYHQLISNSTFSAWSFLRSKKSLPRCIRIGANGPQTSSLRHRDCRHRD